VINILKIYSQKRKQRFKWYVEQQGASFILPKIDKMGKNPYTTQYEIDKIVSACQNIKNDLLDIIKRESLDHINESKLVEDTEIKTLTDCRVICECWAKIGKILSNEYSIGFFLPIFIPNFGELYFTLAEIIVLSTVIVVLINFINLIAMFL